MVLLHADAALSLGEREEAASVLARALRVSPSEGALWKAAERVPRTPRTDALLFSAVRDACTLLSAQRSGNPQARITAACHLIELSEVTSPDDAFAAALARETVAAHPDHPGILELLENLVPEGQADVNTVTALLHRLFPERLPAGLPAHVLAGYGEPLTSESLMPALDSLEGALMRYPTALSRDGVRTALLHVLERLARAATALPPDAVPTARMQDLRQRIVGDDPAPRGDTP
jgi:hypothetical protein